MTKPREKTREELQAEIEDGKKKIRQFENREKMLRQKLSREERRERNHRLIVRGAVFESIVPEAKNMTDEEAAALLRLALTLSLIHIFSLSASTILSVSASFQPPSTAPGS